MHPEKKYIYVRILFLSLITFIIQLYFIPLIAIKTWRPDLILLLILYTGLYYGAVPGTLTGFVLGLFQDAVSPVPVGMSSLANCMVGFIAGQVRQFKPAYNVKLVITLILILIHGIIFYLVYQFKSETTYVHLIYSRAFPNTIYTFTIGLVLSVFFRSSIEEN
jgi:rod shape-determining protein MreD